MLEITRAKEADFDFIWPIFREIVKSGDTYVYAPDITKQQAKIVWFDPKFHTFIAREKGKPVGAYVIRPNHRDLGDHIANAAFVVSVKSRGLGIGKALAKDAIKEAKKAKYKGMQFNFVVSTNKVAINLWKSVRFKIIGTVPRAYRHQRLKKLVPIHIMYRDL